MYLFDMEVCFKSCVIYFWPMEIKKDLIFVLTCVDNNCVLDVE